MKIEINKEVLFQFMASHSKLAQAEYDRNPGYNDKHFSHIAEEAMIKEIDHLGLMDECLTALQKAN